MQGFVKEKEFYKQAACIAIPISLQSVITIGVSMMDNIMVGALGETALSAVALANQFIGIYQIGCMGIGMGASVLTARFWGMKDITSLKKVVTIMFRICIGLALLVFMAPTLLIPDRLMRIYTEEAEVIIQGVLYYRWMVPCYLLHGLTLTSTLILRSAGQVQIPLVSSAGAFFVNIFFNYIFIFGKDQKIGYRIKDLFGECASLLGEYIRVALPVVISDTLLALGNTAVAMVMGRIGSGFVSANSITAVIQQISTVLIQGICHAGCIITGHTLGRGEQEKAQEQAWTFLWLGAIVGAAGAGVILLIRSYVIGLYNITPETKQIAWKLMDAIALIVVFQSVNGVMTKGVLRGGGDTRFLMVADVLFLWIVSVPLGALAGLYWHLDVFWIYVFLKLDQVIKAVWCVFRLKSRKWIKMISVQLI